MRVCESSEGEGSNSHSVSTDALRGSPAELLEPHECAFCIRAHIDSLAG